MARVKVYWNSTKKVFSIQDDTGRVVAHRDHLLLENCKFVVRAAGREKVLREQKKNVHAFVQGYTNLSKEFAILKSESPRKYLRIEYNPYTCANFRYVHDKSVVKESKLLFLTKGRIYEVEE